MRPQYEENVSDVITLYVGLLMRVFMWSPHSDGNALFYVSSSICCESICTMHFTVVRSICRTWVDIVMP